MEEQATWKSHTFTFLVFSGIVVLCSIFFILGMLVGRGQGQKIATAQAASEVVKAEAKSATADAKPDFTFYDSVKKQEPAALQPPPAPAKPAPAAEPPAKAEKPADPPPPVTSKRENTLNYQIGAVRKSADAEKLLSDLRAKDFRGFILAPSAGESNPFYRVQVGPFSNAVEAESAKKKLEQAGYKPILKK